MYKIFKNANVLLITVFFFFSKLVLWQQPSYCGGYVTGKLYKSMFLTNVQFEPHDVSACADVTLKAVTSVMLAAFLSQWLTCKCTHYISGS